uniref:Nuclear factor of kappa light polypeptide gene enhancer in B-cells inhibitor, zeta n=1 Tax=Oryzias latipes TaxID=8090 RepID=A0A3P9MNH5_ORYLA
MVVSLTCVFSRCRFLHIAVAQGRRALAYVLAAKMAGFGSLDIKEHNGQTALQIAAVSNHHLILQDLLTHGAQINTMDLWGRSPLHVCAQKGHFLSLQVRIRPRGNSNKCIDLECLTPLHVAVLSHNAVVKETRQLENPCSFMTSELAQRKHKYLECIKMLMLMGASYGTKVSIELKSGQTCLHMACEEANVDLLQLFLNQPSSLSTFSGNTALHIVSSLQNIKHQAEAAKLLMKRGADPGTRNFENDFPSQLVPGGPIGEKARLCFSP